MTTMESTGAQASIRIPKQTDQASFRSDGTERTNRGRPLDRSKISCEITSGHRNALSGRIFTIGEHVDHWDLQAVRFDRQIPDSSPYVYGIPRFLSTPTSAATPDPTIVAELRLEYVQEAATKLASYLTDLAAKSDMPVAMSAVSRRTFLSDGKTRIVVRQLISRSPEEVVQYADASSIEIDAWIDGLSLTDRIYFDDDIVVDIHWV